MLLLIYCQINIYYSQQNQNNIKNNLKNNIDEDIMDAIKYEKKYGTKDNIKVDFKDDTLEGIGNNIKEQDLVFSVKLQFK